MIFVLLMAFILCITGLWLVLHINLFKVVENIIDVLSGQEKVIYNVIQATNRSDKKNNIKDKILRIFYDTKLILAYTNRSGLFVTIVIISIFLLIGGFLIGIVFNNIFLSFVLAGGLSLIPFWFVKLSENNFKNELNDELETALSIITTSYTRSNSITKAIEENIHHINDPVRGVFEQFLIETRYISSNIEKALERMSKRINDPIFEDWCLEMIACQANRNLKFTLKGIVRKFANIRIANGKLGVDIYEPLRELAISSLMLVCFPIMIYMINADWFNILAHTLVGNLVIAVQFAVVFVVINAGVNNTKPVSYER